MAPKKILKSPICTKWFHSPCNQKTRLRMAIPKFNRKPKHDVWLFCPNMTRHVLRHGEFQVVIATWKPGPSTVQTWLWITRESQQSASGEFVLNWILCRFVVKFDRPSKVFNLSLRMMVNSLRCFAEPEKVLLVGEIYSLICNKITPSHQVRCKSDRKDVLPIFGIWLSAL